MRIASGKFFLALVATLSMMTAGLSAAAGVPAPQAIEEIQELDEIWVRGQHLSEVIEDAEDDFFKLYNKLNKDQAYDVYCGVMALNSSMIVVRKCVPGFIVNNHYEVQTNTVILSTCGSFSFDNRVCSGAGNGNLAAPAQYVPPPPALLSMQHGPAYVRNVLKVVSSDPRLLEMVGNLGDLYDEMDLTQRHFVKIKAADRSGEAGRKYARPVAGPRVM